MNSKIRLFVDEDLSDGQSITLNRDQSHYAVRVMRQKAGDEPLLFNGRHGEWIARIEDASKSACRLVLCNQTRPQAPEPDIWLAFAPIKKSRLDFLVEKSVELGVSRLIPVMTMHTDAKRINVERLTATAMEAAEQCERLSVPGVDGPADLPALLSDWPEERLLYVMDESGQGVSAKDAFLASGDDSGVVLPCAVIVGPEGGFAAEELDRLRNLPFVKCLSLGPRILRSETAAVSALACWQAMCGDGCEVRKR